MGTLASFMAWRAVSFSPIRRVDFGRRSDELDVRSAADFSEVGVLAQQAVAGMDRVDIGDLRSRDDGGNIEIAVSGRGGPMQMASSAKRTCSAVAIGLAVDGDGANAEFPARVQYAQCNFAAIGNQNLTKH